MFKGYKVCPDGIVNGLTKKKRKQAKGSVDIKAAMERKYTTTVHVDAGHLLYIDKATKEYEYVGLDNDNNNWASKVIHAIENLEAMKNDEKGTR